MRQVCSLIGILMALLTADAVRGGEKTETIYEEILRTLKQHWLYELDEREARTCASIKKLMILPNCFGKDSYMSLRYTDHGSAREKETTAVTALQLEIMPPPELEKDAAFVKISMTRGVPHEYEVDNYFSPKFESLRDTRVAGYYIDLNGNLGGYTTGAATFLKYFAPLSKTEQLLFELRGRNERAADTHRFIATQSGIAAGSCIAVLVNKNTASAAEIIAYALQLWGARIVGEPTYKKGTARTTFSLSNGAEFTFTTGKIYYADGTTTHQRGVTPDYITSDEHTQHEEALTYLRKCNAEKASRP